MGILWGFYGDFVGVLWVDRLNLFEMPRRDSNPQTRVYITGLLSIFLIFRGIKGVLVIFLVSYDLLNKNYFKCYHGLAQK